MQEKQQKLNLSKEKSKSLSDGGDFLQSKEWLAFQRKVGRKGFDFEKEEFSARLIEHELPIVGRYMYVPRGPLMEISNNQFPNSDAQIKNGMGELIELAKKENAGWIRIEPVTIEVLNLIKDIIAEKIVKAPYDVQPKEVFVLDISKSQAELLAEMKSKTRYNISVAQKKGVVVSACSKNSINCMQIEMEFLRLTKEMASRQGILAHPESYYKKMLESFPAEMFSIYVAEYEGHIIAANLVLFYGETATYLHGASGNDHRNVMAPFLLQWKAILDAKKRGCTKYDFGGVKIMNNKKPITNNWEGITNFKLGFSPNTKPFVFPGTYDIVINSRSYALYRGLQKAKMLIKKFKK